MGITVKRLSQLTAKDGYCIPATLGKSAMDTRATDSTVEGMPSFFPETLSHPHQFLCTSRAKILTVPGRRFGLAQHGLNFHCGFLTHRQNSTKAQGNAGGGGGVTRASDPAPPQRKPPNGTHLTVTVSWVYNRGTPVCFWHSTSL